jgi:predicted nucleic acid-binding protein
MSWLVDTDVLSERTKATPNARVLDWLRDNAGNINTSSHVISVITPCPRC